jgi:hypothetical protein
VTLPTALSTIAGKFISAVVSVPYAGRHHSSPASRHCRQHYCVRFSVRLDLELTDLQPVVYSQLDGKRVFVDLSEPKRFSIVIGWGVPQRDSIWYGLPQQHTFRHVNGFPEC